MAEPMKSIDISDNPELIRLVEEVERSHEPRLLRANGRTLGVLAPADQPTKEPAPVEYSEAELTALFEEAIKPDPRAVQRLARRKPLSETARQALLSAAGGWKDVDTARFLEENAKSRRLSRAPIEW